MRDVVITHAVRTPIGRIGGSLRNIPDKELGRLVVEDLLKRSGLTGKEIDHVILGHVRQSSDPANTARVVALMAGIPETVPAYTVHRQCGSGLQAVMDASQMIRAGEADIIVAGGTENMSQSVYFLRNARHGLGNGDHPLEDSLVQGGPGAIPADIYGQQPMGITAENLADRYRIPREEQDAFGLESQVRTARAIREGRFREQILPVAITTPDGATRTFDTDEHPRMTTPEKLAALAPAFKKGGSVTAGNSSGRNDGAAALIVMAVDKAQALGMKPMARILAIASSGCDPTIMGIGPVECTRIALERAKITLGDLDVIELNEAFAAQSLAVIRDWLATGIDREALLAKLNPNGGAIAMGHPLGCTGAALADGAAMCLLASREKAEALALPVLAEIVSVGIAATDPRYTGVAVVEASRRALGRAGLTLNEVDIIELNEMSAAECLAVIRDWQAWGVAPEALAERVNPAGGALATGNPWGAMGAVLLARAVHALRRRSARIAMVALGAEGGQGMALVLRNAG